MINRISSLLIAGLLLFSPFPIPANSSEFTNPFSRASTTSGVPGGIGLTCPDQVQFYEPDLMALVLSHDPSLESYHIYLWLLLKGTTKDPDTQDPIGSGSGNSFYYADHAIKPGDVFYYTLRVHLAKDGSPDVRVTIIYGNDGSYDQVTIGEYCHGNLYVDWEISNETVKISGITVMNGVTFFIGPGADIIGPTQGGFIYPQMGGVLIINGATLTNMGLELKDGCSLQNSHLSHYYIHVYDGEKIRISQNSFSGVYASDWNVIKIWTSAWIEGNWGEMTVALINNARAVIENNRFTGLIMVDGTATLENNTISGRVVNYYAEDVMTIVSNTFKIPGSSSVPALFVVGKDSLVARNWFRCLASNCYAVSLYGGNLINNRIEGGVDLHGDSALRENRMGGNLNLVGPGTAVDVDRNQIAGDWNLRLINQPALTFTENIVTAGSGDLDGSGQVVIARNTLNGGATSMGIDLFSFSGFNQLKIQDNCIRTHDGVFTNESEKLVVENNWWGDDSGPWHITMNPNGKGAIIHTSNIDFEPWSQTPVFCRTAPAHWPASGTSSVTSGGGRLYSSDGGARLVFPPGAVLQDTQVSYQESDAGRAQTLAPGGNSLVAVRAFELSAVISGTITPVTTFTAPFTLTLNISEREAGMAVAKTFGLYRWDGSQWRPEQGGQLDLLAQRLVIPLDHTGHFGLLGLPAGVYLPLAIIHR